MLEKEIKNLRNRKQEKRIKSQKKKRSPKNKVIEFVSLPVYGELAWLSTPEDYLPILPQEL